MIIMIYNLSVIYLITNMVYNVITNKKHINTVL